LTCISTNTEQENFFTLTYRCVWRQLHMHALATSVMQLCGCMDGTCGFLWAYAYRQL